MEQMLVGGHCINDSFYQFIADNINCNDLTKLLLKNHSCDFDKKFAITQIECRKKFGNKLSDILLNEKFLFPKSICAEQCTDQRVAQFHASLFNNDDVVLDMTMGLGIDSYYISRVAKMVTSIERDELIADVNRFNYADIAKNLNVVCDDSVKYIMECNTKFSAIFIDPARRDANNKRMFGFSDCSPDVVALLPHIKRCTNRLIIKASPMLDLTKSITELGNVVNVWIIGVKNSCKELLFELDFSCAHSKMMIHTINYDNNIQKLDFEQDTPTIESDCFGTPNEGDVLFEPNCCIMKSGKTEFLLQHYKGLKKFESSSHLFFSDNMIADFPGRQFVIERIMPFKDKVIKEQLSGIKQLNVSTRNFKLTAEQLKARLKVKDGGDKYLFGSTLANGDMVLVLCHKL